MQQDPCWASCEAHLLQLITCCCRKLLHDTTGNMLQVLQVQQDPWQAQLLHLPACHYNMMVT